MKRLIVLALLLAGCSAATMQTGLATSGQTLVGVGNQFIAVAKVYEANCKPAPQPRLEKFCTEFAKYAPQFQQNYPLAVQAYKAAVRANDASKAKDANALILQLSTDMAVIAGQVLVNLGGS